MIFKDIYLISGSSCFKKNVYSKYTLFIMNIKKYDCLIKKKKKLYCELILEQIILIREQVVFLLIPSRSLNLIRDEEFSV